MLTGSLKRFWYLLKPDPLSVNPTKWSNTFKQFIGNLPTKCLSVFDHFVGLALKGLTNKTQNVPDIAIFRTLSNN